MGKLVGSFFDDVNKLGFEERDQLPGGGSRLDCRVPAATLPRERQLGPNLPSPGVSV